jgi:TolB protein
MKSPIGSALLVVLSTLLASCSPNLGQFEGHTDIGDIAIPGTISYNEPDYTIGGSGWDLWANNDGFHYVWKRVWGDVSIAADIEILGDGGHPNKKAFVMIRQDLDRNAVYADAALHATGLASLQYRDYKDGDTHELQSNVSGPRRLSVHKEGDYVYMTVATEGEPLQGGGTVMVKFSDPFYVGIGITAHDSTAFEKAIFSNVLITEGAPSIRDSSVVESTLERINIGTDGLPPSGNRRVVYHTQSHIEAPNWTPDGRYLIYNSGGLLYRIPVEGGAPEQIDTGNVTSLNNDHGISPDGTQLVISSFAPPNSTSSIYTLPIEGGQPKLVTNNGHSFWHGWSPDGSTLAFVGLRNNEFDIYTVPAAGGPEIRLTDAVGLDDGPDYSPDGAYIYFNSVRTGTMQIYRMKADGSEEEQLTHDTYNDWFPHASPDGKWIVFLSYEPHVEGHPANQDVMLRLMPVDGGDIRILTRFFGGQGSINVPSWSPDSREVAFVSYRRSHEVK